MPNVLDALPIKFYSTVFALTLKIFLPGVVKFSTTKIKRLSSARSATKGGLSMAITPPALLTLANALISLAETIALSLISSLPTEPPSSARIMDALLPPSSLSVLLLLFSSIFSFDYYYK